MQKQWYLLLPQGYTIAQKRVVFFKFVEVFQTLDYPQELKAKVCRHCWVWDSCHPSPPLPSPDPAARSDSHVLLLLQGGSRRRASWWAPGPEHDNDENIISVFINQVINPDKPFGSSVGPRSSPARCHTFY